MGSKIFCFQRTSIDKKQTIICVTNLSSKTQYPLFNKKFINWKNLINKKINILPNKRLKLEPFQTIWLSN
jgi:sucrose phosphorylase